MQLTVNGKTEEFTERLTLAELIERLDLAGKRLAIEVNEELIPRSQFTEHRLGEQDRVEIIHAVGGG